MIRTKPTGERSRQSLSRGYHLVGTEERESSDFGRAQNTDTKYISAGQVKICEREDHHQNEDVAEFDVKYNGFCRRISLEKSERSDADDGDVLF